MSPSIVKVLDGDDHPEEKERGVLLPKKKGDAYRPAEARAVKEGGKKRVTATVRNALSEKGRLTSEYEETVSCTPNLLCARKKGGISSSLAKGGKKGEVSNLYT